MVKIHTLDIPQLGDKSVEYNIAAIAIEESRQMIMMWSGTSKPYASLIRYGLVMNIP